MADKKISELPNLTGVDAADLIPIVDVSANTSKRSTVANVAAAIAPNIPPGLITYAQTDGKIWGEELGRAIAGAGGTNQLKVTLTTPRRFLTVRCWYWASGGTAGVNLRLNGDTGTNYALRSSVNGAADVTTPSANGGILATATSANDSFAIAEIINGQTAQKLIQGHAMNPNGSTAAGVPERREFVAKWTNITDLITSIQIDNTGTGLYGVGSILIVEGHD